jgi:hypothetical protein
MKWKIFFLLLIISFACQKPEEEEKINLDQIAQSEEEKSMEQLAGQPGNSPQEIMFKGSLQEDVESHLE